MAQSAPALGAPAPHLELPSATGEPCSLDQFRGRPVMVSFLGPSHCTFCRSHVIRAIQAHDRVRALGAEVIFVVYEDPERIMAQMLRELNLPYRLLVDESRGTYERWGLGRPGARAILAPGFYWEIVKSLLRGDPKLAWSPDPVQMGGDFVVDRRGHLSFVKRLKSFHDRATMPMLIDALSKA
jgi:peroxiredoxin